MRMDPDYEAEEMETNMESMFEHVNQMCGTDMPRDFLASMSRHFLRENGEKFTTFQKFQTEACLLLEQRRPHWRKRKAKSASQFLSMYYLVEQEVMESKDEVAQSLFVEAFHSREAYVESLMEEFDETDRLEKQMSSGNAMNVPGFVFDEDDDNSVDSKTTSNEEFDFNNCVLEISEIIEDLNEVDKSKYVKIFEKDGEASVGIYNTRIKALAKRKSAVLTSFPLNVKSYPKQIKSGTKIFTRLTATSSVGAANTQAGYCMIINMNHFSLEARSRILTVLGREDLFDEAAAIDESSSEEGDLLLSQDFPNMYQSQTSDTLLHCTLCEFMCRSKTEFESHITVHPSCEICKKQVENNPRLQEHMKENHQEERNCTKCGEQVSEREFAKHEKEHEMFESFKKSLDKSTKTPKTPKAKQNNQANKKSKTMNCYLVFVDQMRPTVKANNPTLTPVEITRKISEEWHKLSNDEKKIYKERAAEINRGRTDEEIKCPKCEEQIGSQAELVNHILVAHVESVATTPISSDSGTQSRIFKCSICGKMLLSQEMMESHKRLHHSIPITIQENTEDESTDHAGIDDDTNQVAAISDIEASVTPPNEDDIENDDSKGELVWVKLASIAWPAKMIRKVDGELSEIEMYDGLKTKKIVEHIKLKPFQKLKKIPVKRNKHWKEAYASAVNELENQLDL